MVSSNLALQLEVTTQPKIEVQESPVKWLAEENALRRVFSMWKLSKQGRKSLKEYTVQ